MCHSLWRSKDTKQTAASFRFSAHRSFFSRHRVLEANNFFWGRRSPICRESVNRPFFIHTAVVSTFLRSCSRPLVITCSSRVHSSRSIFQATITSSWSAMKLFALRFLKSLTVLWLCLSRRAAWISKYTQQTICEYFCLPLIGYSPFHVRKLIVEAAVIFILS